MKPLTPELRRQLAARVNFYRELGIYDLYRQGGRAETPADVLPVLGLPAAELESIRRDLGECTRCRLHQGRSNLVFGDGNPRADLMFVGEGPGADEDAQGLPFVGRAG